MKAVLYEALDGRKRKPPAPLMDRGVESSKSRPEVLAAVTELPVQQRAAIYLTYWIGMDSGGAAEQMGCRPATMRRYVHLARKKLEAVLDDD